MVQVLYKGWARVLSYVKLVVVSTNSKTESCIHTLTLTLAQCRHAIEPLAVI